jgi:hypothetical protein
MPGRTIMKITPLFVVLLFVTALSNAVYAESGEGGGTQGANDEPDCDYASSVNPL